MINTRGLDCCAVTEISNLESYATPREAMLAFCAAHSNKYTIGNPMADPGAFIIFTAIIDDREEDGVGICTYGPRFAAYIKQHRLGPVKESVKRLNRNGSPRHLDQVWIWAPNFSRLAAWYKTNNKKTKDIKCLHNT